MNFEIGKLYCCPGYYLLLYPNIEKAMEMGNLMRPLRDVNAVWWSKQFNYKYSYPNEPFMVLKKFEFEENGYLFLNVLFGKKQGWIIYRDWMKMEKIK